MKPLCIDLFCGLGGWSKGFLAEGWTCIGFDVERHDYGSGGYPGQLVLQDILTIHGSQFRNADIIVASPPCQEFSFMAMPFSRGKRIAAGLRGRGEFPEPYTGSRNIPDLTRLFDACFRIRREAIEATRKRCGRCHGPGFDGILGETCRMCWGVGSVTRFIPLIVENVRGAQPWVGKSKYNYGSFHLWGDVPALMPKTFQSAAVKVASEDGGRRTDVGKDARFTSRDCGVESQKQPVGPGKDMSLMRSMSSKSSARKAASAKIAMIPPDLSQWIARYYKPSAERVA